MPIVGYSRASSAFNPVTGIAWAHAYWAEGPEFVALGYANAATVGTFPDEIGTADLIQASPVNTYRSTGFNSHPTVQAEAGSAKRMAATFTSIAQPFTVVAVLNNIGGGVLISNNTADTSWAFQKSTAWNIYGGSAVIGGGTPNNSAHLMVGVFNGASSKVIVDGVTLVTGSAGTVSASAMTLFGLSTTATFNVSNGCQVPFAAIAPSVLGTADLAALLSWSQGHYATP